MTLLFPLGLAALASVLLPLVLHLARRTEQRPTDFAALRWLRHRPRPRHRPRFDELLLLAVRLLLLAGIALALAQPMLTGREDAEPVIAVAPGAAVPASAGVRRIWLAPGFPAIDTAPPAGPLPIASLIRQLDADLPAKAPLTIVVPRILDGADAERPRLSRRVTWRVAGEGRAPRTAPAAPPPILRSDPAYPGARYIAAAIRALGGTDIGRSTAPVASSAPPGGRQGRTAALVWLAAGPIPAAVTAHAANGRTVLVGRDVIVPAVRAVAVWRDSGDAPLVEALPLGRGRILRFTRPLTPAAMPQLLEPDFPHRLAALLVAPPEPARVPASAYAPQSGAPAPASPARPLWRWFAVAVTVLFCIERWLATRPTRATAP